MLQLLLAALLLPSLTVDVAIDCDNVDASSSAPHREPVITQWAGDYEEGSNDFDFYIEVWSEQGMLGYIDPAALPSHGYHDNWLGDWVAIDGHTLTAIVFIDGVEHSRASADCPAVLETTAPPPPPPPPDTPPAPVTTPPAPVAAAPAPVPVVRLPSFPMPI